jgi:hypothetical protein
MENSKKSILLNLILSWHYHKQNDVSYFISLSKTVRKYIENLNLKEQYSCNLFEIIQVSEPQISRIISSIFSYASNKNYPIAQSFAKRFFEIEELINPHITAEVDRFDIAIRADNVFIIIENKLNGANFQLNQMARYVKIAHNKNASVIKLIIIPSSNEKSFFRNISRSVYCLPSDWELPNIARRCRVNNYTCWCDYVDESRFDVNKTHCLECKKLEKYRDSTLVLTNELIDWLEKDCLSIISKKEQELFSAIIQLVEYLKKNTIITIKKNAI